MISKNAYIPYTSKEIKPEGWLRRQLEIQAEGLSGHLDKIWPDIRDSRWIGGNKDGWERVPYWLDGFIPLAYLLENEDMIARAKRYIDGIIAGQKADGWICPCEDRERGRYDMWACFLICKVLVVYYECSGDERIEGVLEKALHNLMLHIRGNTIFNWASARWFEALIPIYWLYERTGKEWLIYLAHMLKVQGTSYKALFEDWKDQKPHTDWNYQTHVVNLAMALKESILASRMSDKENALSQGEADAEYMLSQLSEYHGTAYGHFTGDENLSGNSPIQGSELCSVVEAMYSYEQNFAVTGNPVWLDRAEMLAYNALPATTSADMWTHQYDQLVNQIACVRFMGRPIFGTNSNEAHLFGLEPNFGCCTANFNQGWPKFALSIFYKSDDGILCGMPCPATLKTTIGQSNVEVSIKTDYPFRSSALYTVKCEGECEFELGIRIPSFSGRAKIDGKEVRTGQIYKIKKVWKGSESITLELDFDIKLCSRPENMWVLMRGPLLYSVPVLGEYKMHEYIRDGVERKYPYCDYEIYTGSDWNYAFASEDFEAVECEIGKYPFSYKEPPVKIKAQMCLIDWGFEEGYNDLCARTPRSRKPISDAAEVTLVPYGCTDLRITEMPFAEK